VDLAAIQETVRQAVIAASGVACCEWTDTPGAASFGGGPRIDLVLRGFATLGQDEERAEYDEDLDARVENLCGNRLFGVSVRIETDTQIPGENAWTYATRLQTRLGRASEVKRLLQGTISLVDVQAALPATYTNAAGRRVSLVVVDLQFATVENDTDTSSPGDYIATAEVHSEYLRHGTTQAPVQIAFEGP
jgi:hypothetical protein